MKRVISIILLAVLVAGLIFLMTARRTAPSMIEGVDQFVVWDSRLWQGHSYALVYVWTTFPDFMQRVDLYRFNRQVDLADRTVYKRSSLVLSENLEDGFKRLPSGGYSVRVGKIGRIDFDAKRVAVTFDQGKDQVISWASLPH